MAFGAILEWDEPTVAVAATTYPSNTSNKPTVGPPTYTFVFTRTWMKYRVVLDLCVQLLVYGYVSLQVTTRDHHFSGFLDSVVQTHGAAYQQSSVSQ